MRRRLIDTGVLCKLSLLAIFYIAIGTPLVHPAFHDHSAHNPKITDHGVDHFESSDEKEENIFCPICDFLPTNKFHQSAAALSIETNGQLISKVLFGQFLKVKTFSRQCEPRAPPPLRLVS